MEGTVSNEIDWDRVKHDCETKRNRQNEVQIEVLNKKMAEVTEKADRADSFLKRIIINSIKLNLNNFFFHVHIEYLIKF